MGFARQVFAEETPLQGAGGVGGLLKVKETSGSYANQRLVFLYDANGNVGQIYKAADGSLVAQYEYDAFGNTLKATGAYAQDNKYRFSTKPVDDAFAGVSYLNGTGNPEQIGTQGGLYYYGFRFYAPALGRWINRDPIEEQGGVNLYAFVSNNGVNLIDDLGQYSLGFSSLIGAFVGSVVGVVVSIGGTPAVGIAAGIMVGTAVIGVLSVWPDAEEAAKPVVDLLEERNKIIKDLEECTSRR